MYQTQSKFSGNLHALRGLAAVSVIFFHAKYMNTQITGTGWMDFVSQFGAGVTLFFILSGFSLSLSNYSHIHKPNWLRGYSIKRISRIIPVWYTFIVITWLYHYFQINYQVPWNSVLFSVIPAFPIIPGREQGLVWAGWTVGVELMFYMIFPIVLVLLRNNLKAWWLALLGLMLISVSLRNYAGENATEHFLRSSFPRQAFIFFMGCTFYFMTQRAMEKGREFGFALSMLALSAAAFALWIAYVKGIVSFHYDLLLIVKAFALSALTVFAYINPKLWTLPQFNLYNPVTKFFGDKSYTIYLAHPIVITQLKPLYDPIFAAVPNLGLAFLLFCVVVIVITCAVAAIISTFIEEPLYKRGRALAAKSMDMTVEPVKSEPAKASSEKRKT